MPIVITPQGEYIDSVTGNPVGIPPQRPDIPSSGSAMSEQEMRMMTGAAMTPQEMARENIPPNMDMGMDSMMPQSDMTDIDKVRLLMDMGLSEVDAIEAVVREKSMGTVRPEEFSGQQQMPMARPPMSSPGMGSLPGVPMGGQAPMPMPRPEDLMISQPSRSRDNTYNPRDALNPFNAPNT
jgi:hypothetical protein